MRLTKSQLKNQLDDIVSLRERIAKTAGELERLETDAETFRRTIGQLGKPDYRNDSAVTNLSTARTKLELCESQIVSTQESLTHLLRVDAAEMCRPLGELLADVLKPAVIEIREKITSLILPYCQSRQRAEEIVAATDAACGAQNRLQEYRYLPNSLVEGADAGKAIEGLERIEQILREALRDRPDLQQFLRPSSQSS